MRMIRMLVEAVIVSGVYLKEAKIFEWGMRIMRFMWHNKQGWCLFYLLALEVTGHKGLIERERDREIDEMIARQIDS